MGNPAPPFPRPVQELFVHRAAGAEILPPIQCPPAPGSGCHCQVCSPGTDTAGGSLLSCPCPLPGTPATWHHRRCTLEVLFQYNQSAQAGCLLYTVLALKGRRAVRCFFFTSKIKFSMKPGSCFFLLSPLPRVTLSLVLVLSSV